MDITNRNIWQQACGDTDRNYSEVCLDWDVILNGPGYAGKYPECKNLLKEHNWSPRKITDIKRFAVDMKDGDIVVLRLGTSTVIGVGIIVGNYDWSPLFSDIDGWDLQHFRRVKWIWKSNGKLTKFSTYSLKQGDTTQKLTSPDIIKWLQELEIDDYQYQRQLIKLPDTEPRIVSQEEIGEFLFEIGVSSNSIQELLKEFDELIRIAKWYNGKAAPSEFETVAYLVVPILRALGWTPQKMAIEWKKVDLALFDQLPRKDVNLAIVVEAKKKGNSCLTAKSQAQRYAEGKENCKRLIVTDGLRYGIFIKDEENYKLKAYFNLLNLRDFHPIYKCSGVKEALRIIVPEWR